MGVLNVVVVVGVLWCAMGVGGYRLMMDDMQCANTGCTINLYDVAVVRNVSTIVIDSSVIDSTQRYTLIVGAPLRLLQLETNINTTYFESNNVTIRSTTRVNVESQGACSMYDTTLANVAVSGDTMRLGGTLSLSNVALHSEKLRVECGTMITGATSSIILQGIAEFSVPPMGSSANCTRPISVGIPTTLLANTADISGHVSFTSSLVTADYTQLSVDADSTLVVNDAVLSSSVVKMRERSRFLMMSENSTLSLNESFFGIPDREAYLPEDMPRVVASASLLLKQVYIEHVAFHVEDSNVVCEGNNTLRSALHLRSGTLRGGGILDALQLTWDVGGFSVDSVESVHIVLHEEGLITGSSSPDELLEPRSTLVVLPNASLTLQGETCLSLPVALHVSGSVEVRGCAALYDSTWQSHPDRDPHLPLLSSPVGDLASGGEVFLYGRQTFDCNLTVDDAAPDYRKEKYLQPCMMVSNIDSLTIMRLATLTLGEYVGLEADAVYFNNGSSIVVTGNKALVDCKTLEFDVESEITVHKPNTVFKVTGNVAVNGNLSLGIGYATECKNSPLRVRGDLSFGPAASVKCIDEFWPHNGEYKPVAEWSGDLKLPKQGIFLSCSTDSRVSYSLAKHGRGLLIQFFVRGSWENQKQVYAGFIASVLTFILITAVRMQYGIKNVYHQLVRQPPFVIDLPWQEFRIFLPNFVVAGFIALEYLWLCGIMFHPHVPLPNQLSGIQGWFHEWVYLRATTKLGFVTIYGLFVCFVFIWAVTWVPLLPCSQRWTRSVTAYFDLKMYFPRFLIYHRNVAALGNFIILPVLVILMQPFNCLFGERGQTTVLAVDNNVMCWDSHYHLGLIMLSCVASALLCVLAVYSGSNGVLPLAHPPYRTDLDLRSKGVFEIFRMGLLQLQVMMMAIFDQDVVSLLLTSFVIQVTYLGLTKVSSPCGYRNVNRLRVLGSSVSVWGLFVALACTWYYGPYPLPSCGTTGGLFALLYFAGVLFFIFMHCYEARHPDATDSDSELLTAVKKRQEAIRHLRAMIVNVRRESYRETNPIPDSPVSEEDGGFNNSAKGLQKRRVEISKLQLQYMKELEGYRAYKERFLMPYYLGQAAEGVQSFEMLEVEGEIEYDGWVKGQLLGRGSFGSVYIGVLRGGGLIAVKVIDIRQDGRKRSDEIDKIKREIDFIRTLRHPNIVEYKACTYDDESAAIHIFMEYAVGGSLTSLVKRCTERLGEEVIRLYMLHILTGLSYLHSKGVVHRDIKGENILLDSAGTAKLADFGCAIQTRATQASAIGTLVGSPYWMAPEVIRNKGYGCKADIWSVGCTAVEALNGGHVPWKEFDSVFAAMYHISHVPEPPNNRPTDLSPLCESFLGMCFERDTKKRAAAEDLLKHPWVANFQEYEPRTRDFVQRKCEEDKQKLDDYQTLVDTIVVTDGPEVSQVSFGSCDRQYMTREQDSAPNSRRVYDSDSDGTTEDKDLLPHTAPFVSGGYTHLTPIKASNDRA